MKTAFFSLLIAPLIMVAAFLPAKYWVGPKPETQIEISARSVCRCMHKTLSKEDLDLSDYYDQASTIAGDKDEMKPEVFKEKWGHIQERLRKAESVLFDIESESCYKKAMENLQRDDDAEDKLQALLDDHCRIMQLLR